MFTLYIVIVYISTFLSFYNPTKYISYERISAMVKLNVLALLEKKGKTKYWLYKQLGMSYQNFNKMVNNETKSIRYEMIDTLCVIFECTPNELFIFEVDK